MADTFFIEGLNTLPEQVQLNKEDIAKLKDDISKIKPNAWEERKFSVDTSAIGVGDTPVELTTYNPITNTNAPVNIQRVFTNKDTYTLSDAINSYSFAVSNKGSFAYVVCADPSLQLVSLLPGQLKETTENAIVLSNIDASSSGKCWLFINCRAVNTYSLAFDDNRNNYITKISNDDDDSSVSLLTASAINRYYLKKTDASNTYLTKTDASNTYVTKQDYEERIDTGDITLTQNGFDKISAMTEDVGTTITLTHTTDFTEHIQVTNTRELILNVYYNGDPIYINIHLVPNQTIDDYTAVQEGTENWYTGHAILVLPSQDYGYFAVSYQNGNYSQLILTLIAHY